MYREKLSTHESFDETPLRTVYGERFLHAHSPVVFVAPHGIDDRYTAEIVRGLAQELDAGYIVNTEFTRRSYDGIDTEHTMDFNRPHFPSVDGQSCMDAPAGYREFLQDYHCLSHLLLMRYPTKRPAIIHIHGMKERGDSLIDIGIGTGELAPRDVQHSTRSLAASLLSIDTKAGSHITAELDRTQDLRDALCGHLEESRGKNVLSVSIGKYHTASEPNRLSQIGAHLGRHIDEVQIELAASLREESQRGSCVDILSKSLREVYISSEQ